ncbi:MAG: adenylosuccinate synthase [Bacteroidales bacterium]|jgi:adenylosuccinate synthase|nr:adenylosuccinate synthase [Bacteroidales bacterium]
MKKIDVILGLQWGDEGKGKIVDALAPNYDIIARFQGGPNAGHTLEFDGHKYVLHTIPSGIFHNHITNVIGNGVLIDAHIFMKEIAMIRANGYEPSKNLKISQKAHLILPTHRMMDAALEQFKGKEKIGSTLKGIGPTYTDKTARHGLRLGDSLDSNFKTRYEALKATHIKQFESLNFDWKNYKIEQLSLDEYEQKWFSALEEIKKFDIISSEYFINQALNEGKNVLAEGAQGTLLDVDFGSYPFVTSSNTTTAGVCTGLGVAPNKIGKVYGVFKAYCTRVGSGPFPTELHDEIGEKLRKNGNEFGSTTGRPRRCGWLDLPALNYAIMINGVTNLIVTKIDVLNDFSTIELAETYAVNGQKTVEFPSINLDDIKTHLMSFEGWNHSLANVKTYEELPKQAKHYLDFVEKSTDTRISIVSTGPNRLETIYRSENLCCE